MAIDPDKQVFHIDSVNGEYTVTRGEQKMIEEEIESSKKTDVIEIPSQCCGSMMEEVRNEQRGDGELPYDPYENEMTETEKKYHEEIREEYDLAQSDSEMMYYFELIDKYSKTCPFIDYCRNRFQKILDEKIPEDGFEDGDDEEKKKKNKRDVMGITMSLKLIGLNTYKILQGYNPVGYNPNVPENLVVEIQNGSLICTFLLGVGKWYHGFTKLLLDRFDERIKGVEKGIDEIYEKWKFEPDKKDAYMKAIASNHDGRRLEYATLPRKLLEVLIGQFIFGFRYLPPNIKDMVENGDRSIFVDTKCHYLFPGFTRAVPMRGNMGSFQDLVDLIDLFNIREYGLNLADALIEQFLKTTAVSVSRARYNEFQALSDKLWDAMDVATKFVRKTPMRNEFEEVTRKYWKNDKLKEVTVTKPKKFNGDENDLESRINILMQILERNSTYWDTYTNMKFVNKKMFKNTSKKDGNSNNAIIIDEEEEKEENEKNQEEKE